MTGLGDVIRELREQIDRPARVGIVSDGGHNDESSLKATREGYLSLALQLLEFVHAADEGQCESLGGALWADNVRQALFDFPVYGECQVVGAYLYPTTESLLEGMNKFLQGVLPEGARLEDNPDFLEG